MKRSLPLFAFASLAAVFSLASSQAATLASATSSGNDVSFANNEYVFATSWTFGVDHTDVSVSAFLGYFGEGRAYLMRDIGTGITAAAEVGRLDFTPTSMMGATMTLFQNQDLVAGTYYLVIQGKDSSGVTWRLATATSAAENVTVNPSMYAGVGPYAPGSNFVTNASQFVYTVSGNAAVPEPASATLALAGAALLVLRRRGR